MDNNANQPMTNGVQYTTEGEVPFVEHHNLKQEIIRVTEDKVRLILADLRPPFLGAVGGWLSSLLAAIVTLVSVDTFADFFISGGNWKTVFVVLAFLSALFVVVGIWKWFAGLNVNRAIQKMKGTESVPVPKCNPSAKA